MGCMEGAQLWGGAGWCMSAASRSNLTWYVEEKEITRRLCQQCRFVALH